MSDADVLLPERSVLVHVGPYKTGTTAIQTSLHRHRADMLAHGVLYPGEDHRQFRQGWALMGRGPRGVKPVHPHEWDDMVEEVRRSDAARVCISTEDLASAEPDTAAKLVHDLGSDRVHLAMVVRRLDRLMPSAWQQRVKSSNEWRSYEQWLEEVLADEPAKGPGSTFWHNHGVDALLGRWLHVLPPDQMTLVVADESDRSQLMRTFEALLGLPDGLLTPGPRDNSSLTLDRIELYRRLNEAFDRHGWTDDRRRRLLHRGMLNGLRDAPPHETDVRIPELPRWAAERVVTLSDQRVAEVVGSGARIIGDPESLRYRLPDDVLDEVAQPETIRIEVAARAMESLVEAALKAEAAARRDGARSARRRATERASARVETAASGSQAGSLQGFASRQLLREMVSRQRSRVGRRLHR